MKGLYITIAAAAAICAIASAVLAASQIAPAQQAPPTFRASTTLVEFTMVVQDRQGRPITDLKKEEISILENDQPRETAVFRFSGATQDSAHPQPLPAGVFSNRSGDAPGSPHNFVAIVFDAMNTPLDDKFMSQASLHAQMQRYLTRLPPNTLAATYLLKYNVKMLHDFTDDFEALRASMAKTDKDLPPLLTKPQPTFGGGSAEAAAARAEMAAFDGRVLSALNGTIYDQKIGFTLAGLETIGNQLAGLPGRKSLVWASSGMPILVMVDPTGIPKSYVPAIEKTARRLASQGIAIYSVWGRGRAMDMLSGITGGRVVGGLNDPARGITVATADQSGVYSLGFYTAELDDQWHRLKVKVSRPGANILYQQGYMSVAPAARPQEWSPDQWRIAATRPLGSTVIHFDADAHLVSGALQTTLFIAADDLHFNNGASEFDIAIVESTSGVVSDLRHVPGYTKLPESGTGKGTWVRYAKRWDINPRSTEIRLIVHDRFTGAYGSLDLAVKQIIPAGTTPNSEVEIKK